MQLLGHILIHPLFAIHHTFKHTAVTEEWNFKRAYEHFLFDPVVWWPGVEVLNYQRPPKVSSQTQTQLKITWDSSCFPGGLFLLHSQCSVLCRQLSALQTSRHLCVLLCPLFLLSFQGSRIILIKIKNECITRKTEDYFPINIF